MVYLYHPCPFPATGIRFAQCVFPADAPLTLGDFFQGVFFSFSEQFDASS